MTFEAVEGIMPSTEASLSLGGFPFLILISLYPFFTKEGISMTASLAVGLSVAFFASRLSIKEESLLE
jgi:hypothetical protein